MAKSAKYLLIGSIEPYTGKSATIAGMIPHLQSQGLSVAYGKPLGTCTSNYPSEIGEEDVQFIARALDMPKNSVQSPLLYLDSQTIKERLQNKEDYLDYPQALQQYILKETADLVLLEGPGNLWEGSLFDLSLEQIAETLDASILLVARYHPLFLADSLLKAKKCLGERLSGVSINNIPLEQLDYVRNFLKSFLEQKGIPILGTLPRSDLLRSVSVREIADRLEAKVLCRRDRLDLMVESLTIGAMNVNSALEYFRQRRNMAVVTGGDRSELQMAALETSTQCLILTGNVLPQPIVLNRAEDLEIPILSVDLDTLTTVEIVNRAFGQVRIQEPIKVQCIQHLMKEYFDFDRLLSLLGLEPAVTA